GRKRLYQSNAGYRDRGRPLGGLVLCGGRNGPTQLLVEPDEVGEPEPPHRGAAVGDDVVGAFEHAELIPGQQRGRHALEQRGGAGGRGSEAAGGRRAGRNGMWKAGRLVPGAAFIRVQRALHVTASGPPSSIGRSGASASTASRTARTTSSIQIGWTRCVPGP